MLLAPLQLTAEGAVLEGGEEGVEAGELFAVARLLPLDRLDRGGELLLEGKRGEWDRHSAKVLQSDKLLGSTSVRRRSDVIEIMRAKKCPDEAAIGRAFSEFY